ncbi:MAG: HAD-IB family phosphatase [Candidatus Levybacteria bacterium]|nr:HAD-IB family phosphatase [Candidatus Levybacteria bacterium]
MKNDNYFIIDFDSTFVQVESLDELAKIALRKRRDKNKILKKIENTTNLGMEGKILFRESLLIRLKLFSANKNHIKELIKILKRKITPSILRNKKIFKINSNRIYIISGGFREYVFPVVKDFGIKGENVLTNSFIFDTKGNITGFDKNNPLSKTNGKAKVIKKLNLNGKINIIGDGYTDYQVKEQKAADKFYAFVENIKRESVISKADYILENFDKLISILKANSASNPRG